MTGSARESAAGASDVDRIRQVLIEAERSRVAVGPVSDLVPGGLDLDLAHNVCEATIAERVAGGERIAGYKVGFTNIAVRDKMGLPDSTYGYLLDSMVMPTGSAFAMDEFVAPKIETEICFRLRSALSGPDLSVDDVLAATDAVCGSFEICDARIRDWKCPYPDFFADNGFSARIVLSGAWRPLDEVDLLAEPVVLTQDGRQIAEGRGENALGHPAKAVAWLAGKLSARGRSLEPGMLVMTGTLTPILPIERGSAYTGTFRALGQVDASFA